MSDAGVAVDVGDIERAPGMVRRPFWIHPES